MADQTKALVRDGGAGYQEEPKKRLLFACFSL